MQENQSYSFVTIPLIHPKMLSTISHLIYLSPIQIKFVKYQKLNTTRKQPEMYTRI